jgi:hypothetical protein
MKAYRDENPEITREIVRKHRAANPNSLRIANKKWRDANPEKIKEKARLLRANNPGKSALISQKWRDENPEKSRASSAAYQVRRKMLAAEKKVARTRYVPTAKPAILFNLAILNTGDL